MMAAQKAGGKAVSWRIFLHSVRQVFGNLGGALRVSAVLMLAQVLVGHFLGAEPMTDRLALEEAIRTGQLPVARLLLAMVLQLVLWLWLVVGWHRYVLLNEQPGVVPVLRPDRMLGYFGFSFLIGLMLIPVALGLGLVMSLVLGTFFGGAAGNMPLLLTATVLVVYLPTAVIAMRLSVTLPGAALEGGVPLMTGWNATQGQTGTIAGLVLICIAIVIGLEWVILQALPMTGPAGFVVMVVLQWAYLMVGASILTTLYGHFVERRALV